jgi:UDP-N-acetylmuramoyl-tripeptide--D-alanyl-D-alanine ligase
MLAALAATPVAGRRVAVLGEMLELGDASRTLHEACGRAAAAAGVAALVVVGGPAADAIVLGARAAGIGPAAVHRFADSRVAGDTVARLLGAGDVALVKGSRGTRTDLIVDRVVELVGVAA